MPLRIRTVRYQPRFEHHRLELRARVPRLEQILDGLEWLIARSPEHCPIVWGTMLRYAMSDAFPGAPQVVVIFTIEDGDQVCHVRDLWTR